MNTNRVIWLTGLTAVAGLATLNGCGDGKDSVAVTPPPVGNNNIPDSAGASPSAFIAVIKEGKTDDETGEPRAISSTFMAPAEDTGEPGPLT